MYTPKDGLQYSSLADEGTTYDVGFQCVLDLLGNLAPATALDFGCGTGRSARLLLLQRAKRVIAIDRNPHMLTIARRTVPGPLYVRASGELPIRAGSIDVATCLNVLPESSTHSAMTETMRQLARALRRGGRLVVMTTSPAAHDSQFRSFSHRWSGALRSGDPVVCIVQTPRGPVEIQDYYWSEGDYRAAIEEAGLELLSIQYPLPVNPEAWSTDERSVPPFVVMLCRRP